MLFISNTYKINNNCSCFIYKFYRKIELEVLENKLLRHVFIFVYIQNKYGYENSTAWTQTLQSHTNMTLE